MKAKTVMVGEQPMIIDERQAKDIYRYLIKNDYIDTDDNVTDGYRTDLLNGNLAQLPDDIQPLAEGVHTLVQSIFDESVLESMIENGNKTKVKENELNENFFKKEFQTLWNYINHKYAYTVEFDSKELIEKSIAHINNNLFVSQLQYTRSIGQQKDDLNEHEIERGASFKIAKTKTQSLKHSEVNSIKYDLIGKIAEGTVLTRRSVVDILKGLTANKP